MKLILRRALVLLNLIALSVFAQVDMFEPITESTMRNPDPSDWIMINRTYDQQRYSPLNHIDRENVSSLSLAWSRGLPQGTQETVPVVYNGIMYLAQPGASILAIDATTGDEIWNYRRNISSEAAEFVGRAETARTKNIGIYDDMVFYPAPDGYLVALDVRDGRVRWETEVFSPETNTQHTGGVLVADGKVLQIEVVSSGLGVLYQHMMPKLAKKYGNFIILQNLELVMGIVGASFQSNKGLQVHGGCPGLMTLSKGLLIGVLQIQTPIRGLLDTVVLMQFQLLHQQIFTVTQQ